MNEGRSAPFLFALFAARDVPVRTTGVLVIDARDGAQVPEP